MNWIKIDPSNPPKDTVIAVYQGEDPVVGVIEVKNGNAYCVLPYMNTDDGSYYKEMVTHFIYERDFDRAIKSNMTGCLSDDSKFFWAWIVQREYAHVLECYLHIKDEYTRIAFEQSLIIRLDEYNRILLGRSLAYQIELNKKSKMCDPNLPSLFDRYPDLFPKINQQ